MPGVWGWAGFYYEDDLRGDDRDQGALLLCFGVARYGLC